MKHFKPVTVKLDDAALSDLDRIIAAEKRKNRGYAVTVGAVIRGLIHEKARRVPRETKDTKL